MTWAVLAALGLLAVYSFQSTVPSNDTSGSSDGSSSDGLVSYNGDPMQGLADNLYDLWIAAIQQHEGGNPGDRNMRNNNPGNLRIAGNLGKDADGFGRFSSYDLGRAALKADLQGKVRKYPGYSILQIMTRYLGGDVNNPQVTDQGDPFSYARAVANALGVDVNTTLGDLSA